MYKIFKTLWQVVKPLIPRAVREALFEYLTLGAGEIKLIYGVLDWKKRSGVMVDVGAHFGTTLLPFARLGWAVHAFEPDAKNRAVLESNTAKLPNVNIDIRALSNEAKKDVPFYTSEISTGVSGLTSFAEGHHETYRVELITFEQYCEEKNVTAVDVFKVDTEGFDLFVLKGIPWETVQPEFILAEFEDRKTQSLGYTFHDLASFLTEKGYHVLVSEWFPVRQYGTAHKWRDFWVYPGEPRGGELAHGNLIAVKDKEAFEKIRQRSRSWYLRTKFRNLFYGL